MEVDEVNLPTSLDFGFGFEPNLPTYHGIETHPSKFSDLNQNEVNLPMGLASTASALPFEKVDANKKIRNSLQI